MYNIVLFGNVKDKKNVFSNKHSIEKSIDFYFYIFLVFCFFKVIKNNRLAIKYEKDFIREDKLVFLDFSHYKVEDYILNHKSSNLKEHIFNNNFILETKNMDNFKKSLKQKIIFDKKNIRNKKISILNDNITDYELVRKLDRYNEEYKNICGFNNIFEYIDNIESNKTCPICHEKIIQNHMLITDCCHSFCIKCFLSWKDKNKKCPQCRKYLKTNNITHIIENQNINIIDFYKIDYLTKFIGTKLTFIIKYIYENSIINNVLFLSNNNNILNIVSDLLNKFNLKNIIYKKKQTSNISIILYDYSKKCNITLCNKSVIIFNEPIEKEKEKNILKDICNEKNMIVKTIKFIIRGTKEDNINLHQLY
jgi:hypothetical protein